MIMGFLLTFFNSGLLILLINANFTGIGIDTVSEIGPILDYFDGEFMDFDDKWFQIVAPIFISSMLIRITVPPAIIIMKIALKKILIILDRRSLKPSSKGIYTSQISNLDYVELHSGDVPLLSHLYNKILLNIMMCMMLGLGIPILFPLTLISLVVIYVSYKIALLQWYQKPPKLDEWISRLSIHILSYGALFYCGFSYWMLCNRQMFENYVLPKSNQDQVENHGHSLFYNPNNHTYILMMMFFIIIVFLIYNFTFYDVCNICVKSSVKNEIQHFENLLNFYKSISNKNLEMWISEERLVRNEYGYKVLFDDTYERMIQEREQRQNRDKFRRLSLRSKRNKVILDESSYSLMTIPYYYEKVGYIPVAERDLSTYRKQNISVLNDTRLIFDYPYFAGMKDMSNLFKSADGSSRMRDSQFDSQKMINDKHGGLFN